MDNLTAGNPIAHRVRVYYTGSDTIHEGEPLNYSFKTTRSWFGGTVNDRGEVTTSEYVAEGSHNASKYICVESPFQTSTTTATSTLASNVLTDNGAEFDNLHVGMAVSIASGTDSGLDGNYVISAVSAADNTITLDMTAAQLLTISVQTDITVQIDNLSSFAGVVCKGGWCGRTGPIVLDIYVPNGAVVPVLTDQNCVLGKTILAVHTNEQFLTAPHALTAIPVAIAWETVDRGSTAGLVLAKLDTRLFIWQRGDGALEIDDKDTTSALVVNTINLKFLGTSSTTIGLYCTGSVSGGAVLSGMWKFETHQTGTPVNHIHALAGDLVYDGDAAKTRSTSGELDAALRCSISTAAGTTGADLGDGDVACILCVSYIDDACTTPNSIFPLYFHSHEATYHVFTHLFGCRHAADIGIAAQGGSSTQTWGSGDITIPIQVGDATYYIYASDTANAS